VQNADQIKPNCWFAVGARSYNIVRGSVRNLIGSNIKQIVCLLRSEDA